MAEAKAWACEAFVEEEGASGVSRCRQGGAGRSHNGLEEQSLLVSAKKVWSMPWRSSPLRPGLEPPATGAMPQGSISLNDGADGGTRTRTPFSRSRFSYHLGFHRRLIGVRGLDYPFAKAFRP